MHEKTAQYRNDISKIFPGGALVLKSKTGKAPKPGEVTSVVSIHYTFWERCGERLDALRKKCPHVRMQGDEESSDGDPRTEYKSRDAWGCLWHSPGSMAGVVVEHPLDDWDKLRTWRPPSPDELISDIRKKAAERSDSDPEESWHGSLDHAFVFQRLTFLRGFENFMIDVAEDNPMLYELRDIVTDYWCRVTQAHLDCGATLVGAGDDLGLQDRLPISPPSWRKIIKPAYSRIIGLARERGAGFNLHTDGYIVDIIPDLIETGLTQLNPQDLINGLDNLARLAKGKLHIALDIDRQKITAFGTPEQVRAHIRNCIETLGSPEGGLTFVFGAWPGMPIVNLEAAILAMEQYHDMWVK